mgnify:FL=1
MESWNVEIAGAVLDAAKDSGWVCASNGVWSRTLELASVTDSDTREFIVYALGNHDSPPGVTGRIHESRRSLPLKLIISISPVRKPPTGTPSTPRSLFGTIVSASA